MIRRPRRSLPATLVALMLLATAVLVAVSCIQVLLGQPALIPFAALAHVGTTLTWTTPGVLAAGAVAAVLGLVLLAAAILPGRATVIPLAGSGEGTSAGVARRSLRRELAATARDADGVAATRILVTRGRIRARVRTAGGTSTASGEQVRRLLAQRLDELTLARRPRLRVRVRADRRRS